MRILIGATILVVTLSAFAVSKSRYEELELFNKVLYLIENKYYRDVDTKKLIEGAIKGMMDTLDPHSAYLGDEVFKKMQDDTDGQFGGLGIEVTQKDGVIYVVTPIEDSPAYRSGILSKDKIVEINHESILGYTLDEAIDLMKGKQGSKIHLGIVREGEKGIQHFELKREIIKVKSVKSALVKKNFAYIRLIQFQRNAAKSIWGEYKKLEKKSKKYGGLKGIILDLRSNPGGLLNEAVNVTSLFVKEGIVVSTEARDPNNKDIHYVIKSMEKDLETPLVVLVNGASASASEIVAGAIQDHKRGMIMGSQTFGKGSVQTVVPIDDENGVKLTIAQYMTPKNRKIQALGIVPDIEIAEMENSWMEENEKQASYIREKDLRNHLTATIETAEEKEARLEEEKKERIERAERIQARKKKKNESKGKEDIFRKYKASDDYQVLQAIKFIKTFSFYQKK
ncbi:MAG: S41 family peptidase [Bdellovibrionota bacterium]|nr:S41 family peptidase [Bdellovibrionota bacterium]